jgi:hypothetical protein
VSPEAWGFFTSISLALIAMLSTQMRVLQKQRHAERLARRTVLNTIPISNGFVAEINRKLRYLQQTMDSHIDEHELYQYQPDSDRNHN